MLHFESRWGYQKFVLTLQEFARHTSAPCSKNLSQHGAVLICFLTDEPTVGGCRLGVSALVDVQVTLDRDSD